MVTEKKKIPKYRDFARQALKLKMGMIKETNITEPVVIQMARQTPFQELEEMARQPVTKVQSVKPATKEPTHRLVKSTPLDEDARKEAEFLIEKYPDVEFPELGSEGAETLPKAVSLFKERINLKRFGKRFIPAGPPQRYP